MCAHIVYTNLVRFFKELISAFSALVEDFYVHISCNVTRES